MATVSKSSWAVVAAQTVVQASFYLPAKDSVSDLWGRAGFPAAASSPVLRTAACTERCVTKPSKNTAGLTGTAHLFAHREKELGRLRTGTSSDSEAVCTRNRQVGRS